MCKSLAEGGQRCAADTRAAGQPAVDSIEAGNMPFGDHSEESEKTRDDAIAYAATAEGQDYVQAAINRVTGNNWHALEGNKIELNNIQTKGLMTRKINISLGDAYNTEILRTQGAVAYAERLNQKDLVRLAKELNVNMEPTFNSWGQGDVEGCAVTKYLDMRLDTINAGDAIIMTDFGDKRGPCVLMIERENPPFNGSWAFPGGIVDDGEDMGATIDREMEEEVRVTPDKAIRTHVLGDNVHSDSWDPRYPHARVGGKVFEVNPDLMFEAADDAVGAAWVPIKDLASGKQTMAFGHANWLARMYEPGSPYANEVTAKKFAVLVGAAKVRHNKMAKEVNKIRAAGGYELLPIS